MLSGQAPLRAAVLPAVAMLGACSAAPNNTTVVMLETGGGKVPFELREIEDEGELKAMGPEGWHWLALYGNWDFVTVSAWRWIVSQPDCDRATALAIFWKASPEYYLQYASRDAAPAGDRPIYDLLTLIRDRWLAGGYTHAAYAFDPDTDAWPLDFPALRAKHGARVDTLMPQAMRVRLAGKRVEQGNKQLPGTYHGTVPGGQP